MITSASGRRRPAVTRSVEVLEQRERVLLLVETMFLKSLTVMPSGPTPARSFSSTSATAWREK